jgi:hypothetical protein
MKVARWSCGCASFSVEVDRNATPAIDAQTKQRDDPLSAFDLLLWVDDGWLAGVEIVDYIDRHGDQSPNETPSPEEGSRKRGSHRGSAPSTLGAGPVLRNVTRARVPKPKTVGRRSL